MEKNKKKNMRPLWEAAKKTVDGGIKDLRAHIEEKKRKQDEISRQKQEEKLKKMHDVEVKRQQAAIYKEQVRYSIFPFVWLGFEYCTHW